MKVLLIDDHPLILTALQAVISGLGEDIAVTGAQSAAQAWACLRDTPDFDLALLDLVLGDADGFEVLVQMRQEHPQVPVVILSASENAGDVVRALDLGAMGFVPKRASTQALVEALRIVMSGGLFVPQHLFGPNRGRVPEVAGPQDLAGAVAKSLEHLGLTPRQHDVLSGLLKGLPNKLIARELSLSVDTVKDHVASVLRALNVTSRTQAVLAVSRMAQGQPGAVSWRRGRHG
jgi:DNA-binding NarL/FixJ family response regulator